MEKTITICGRGSACAAPDWIEITIELTTRHADYNRVMGDAAQRHARLLAALAPLGFRKDDVKTTLFNVDTEYDNQPDNSGRYTRQFKGYCCNHHLAIDFSFSMKNLSSVLERLTASGADPEFSIRFTVQDLTALRTRAMVNATANAYRSASVLTQASRTSLGSILKIEYGETKHNAYSPTSYGAEASARVLMDMSRSMDITPDDVQLEDTVTITWEVR